MRIFGPEIVEKLTDIFSEEETRDEEDGHEIEQGYKPAIKPLPVNLADYDTIIIGTPVWWYTYAPAVAAFLSEYNLSGKTIIPFATNGGWIGHTFKDIKKACDGADVKMEMNIRFNGAVLSTPEKEIQTWIHGI